MKLLMTTTSTCNRNNPPHYPTIPFTAKHLVHHAGSHSRLSSMPTLLSTSAPLLASSSSPSARRGARPPARMKEATLDFVRRMERM